MLKNDRTGRIGLYFCPLDREGEENESMEIFFTGLPLPYAGYCAEHGHRQCVCTMAPAGFDSPKCHRTEYLVGRA